MPEGVIEPNLHWDKKNCENYVSLLGLIYLFHGLDPGVFVLQYSF